MLALVGILAPTHVQAEEPLLRPDPYEADAWTFFHPEWGSGKRSPDQLAALLHDPLGRIEADFQVPKYLRDRVLFWMQIYTFYDTRMRVVHDKEDPTLIYGYLDFRPLHISPYSRRNAEIHSNKVEKEVLKRLKAKIIEASVDRFTWLPAPERTEIREMLSRHGALSEEAAVEKVKRFRTQTGQSDQLALALQRAETLLPHIERVLKEHDLPVALARLPIVESSYNVKARSKVGALGIWQLMPTTARQMMRKRVNRNDPMEQTIGAARLLRMYRKMLPDWSTTLTSYNSGVGRLRKLVQRYEATSMERLMNENDRDGLGFAGRNFYSQFLCVNLLQEYRKEIFRPDLNVGDYWLASKRMEKAVVPLPPPALPTPQTERDVAGEVSAAPEGFIPPRMSGRQP